MKKLLLVFALLLSGFVYAQDPESLVHSQTSYVNDFDNVFDESQRQELDAMMRSFHDTVQITLVTVNSLNGLDRSEYAVRLGNHWGVGSHSNNGLLILICVPEHQFFAATGGGIQGDLTDLQCARYYDEIAKPRYREGDYFGGTQAVLAKYINTLSPSAKEFREKQEIEEAAYNKKITGDIMLNIGYFILVASLIGLIIFGIIRYYRKKEEEAARIRALREQEVREFNKIKDRYLMCYREVQKLNETLQTSPFKIDVNKVLESLDGLIPKVFVENPEKKAMEDYIDKYNLVLKSVKPLIDDINKKTSILADSKKIIDENNDTNLKKKEEQVVQFENSLKKLMFSTITTTDNKELVMLRNSINNVRATINNMVQAYGMYDTLTLVALYKHIEIATNSYKNVCNTIQSILNEDADKVRIGKTGKDILISKIEQYQSYCNKKGVSAATSEDTKQKCVALLEQVNHQFSDDIITNYGIYNALVALLPNLDKAKKEYDTEQLRLQKIKDEEERKRKEKEEEEERKRRKKRQEEDDERRRQSSYSSINSYSSNDNNSSSSSVSFGGGSFDGGGGGGSW